MATFTTVVDDDGEFVVVIRDLTAPSPLGDVVADIALRGIIVDTDTLCGAADGAVSAPLQVDLEGTTFGAVRIPNGSTEEPEDALDACP